ncbi:MAG: biotin/lipoyl-binding protein [Oscillospiraceae bacterium]|nr:biotin/lipoyl-binding protein [Oscillospiraceae bacterium]
MKTYKITVDGVSYDVVVEEVSAGTVPAAPASAVPKVSKTVAAPTEALGVAEGNPVNAPVPGTILKIGVKTGDTVKKGQLLLVLEAMKLENEIFSPFDGTVSAILVKEGDSVKTNDKLAFIK